MTGQPPRFPLALLQLAAVALAVGGTLGLLFAARLTPVPELTLAQLTAAQNFAYVRVTGQLLQPPAYNPEARTLSFRLTDGERALAVTAFRAESEALLAVGDVPAAGDTVTAEGTLRVRDDFTSLTLANPAGLVIRRPTPQAMPIGQALAAGPGNAVTLQASVAAVRQPFEGLTLVTLADPSGAIDLALDEAAAPLTGPPRTPAPGETVQVSGVLTPYRDTLQLTLIRAGDLRPLPPEALARPTPGPGGVMPIAAAIPGQPATVEGALTAAYSFSGGFRFRLEDGSGALLLTLPEALYRQLPDPAGFRPGARVRAQGLVTARGSELQLTPAALGALTLLAPGAPPADPPTPIGQIGLARLGQTLAVEGEIVEAAPFERGLRLTLADDSGALTVLLWQNVLAYAPDAAELAPGRWLRVTGLVQQYQSVMEIVPQLGFDVELQ